MKQPVRQFAAKSQRIDRLMRAQGFSEDQIHEIVTNLRPATVDAVLQQLEEWGAEDHEA